VIRSYTAGQTADLGGSIDAFHQMAKSKESTSLAERLHQCLAPVLLLVGTVEHSSEVPDDQRKLMKTKLRTFNTEAVRGAGQFIQEEQPAVVLAALTRLNRVAQ
jgi:hypothetical protein